MTTRRSPGRSDRASVGRAKAGAIAIVLTAAAALATHPVAAQEPSIAAVLDRAGEYVTAFQRQLSGVVAEETYVQDVREPMPSGAGPRAPMRGGPTHRELKSDLLLVKPANVDRWIQFQEDVVADLLVPVAMRERYVERRNSARIDGAATYGKFRQFQVKVDDKIAPIKEK